MKKEPRSWFYYASTTTCLGLLICLLAGVEIEFIIAIMLFLLWGTIDLLEAVRAVVRLLVLSVLGVDEDDEPEAD